MRLQGKLTKICASTGIAALEYQGGVTAHSLFKIPVQEDACQQDNSDPVVCAVGGRTQRAQLLRQCAVIIWDEIAMMSRHNPLAVDRLLRDLCDTPDVPFGGKIFIIAGDFR